MRQTGELVDWRDERGFGFIRAADGEMVFVHISAIDAVATRPRVGDIVSFDLGPGRNGRPAAVRVAIAGANPAASRAAHQRGLPARAKPHLGIGWRLALAMVLGVLLVLTMILHPDLLGLGAIYLVMGLLSLTLYYSDKRRAEAGAWRISEATLLGVDLAGGITGGLIAQEVFRHKTVKRSYLAMTVLLAITHLLWLGGLAAGQIDVMSVLQALGL